MSPENPGPGAPAHEFQNNRPAPAPGRSATGAGIVALVLCAATILSAPALLLIPYIGFLPALIASGAIVAAWSGLRKSDHGNGLAVTGLITGVILFAILAGLATVWNLVVADPAVRDYDQLHEVIDYIKSLIFG